MREERHEVLVVGAGLAGLSLAAFLGVHGITALVVERHAGTSVYPKARGQFPHTMEALRVAGVDRRLAEAAPGQAIRMIVAATVAGPVERELRLTPAGGFGRFSPAGWANASQELAEPILADRARELGVDVRFATELQSFDQDGDGVTALVRDLATGTETRVRADYLIGADGHRSPIRAALGIGVHGPGVLGHGIGAVFEADLADERYLLCYLRNPALPGAIGVVETTDRPHRYAINVGFVPWRDRVADFTPARWVEMIRAAAGRPDLAVRLVDTADAPTELAARVADRFSHGRVHLIGDAARVMPPTGGMGGNTAIIDAYHLGWKLAMVLDGRAGPRLLDSHDAERRPYADLVMAQQYAHYVRRLRPDLDDGSLPGPVEPASVLFGYRQLSGAVLAEPDDDGALLEDPDRPTGRPGSRAPHVPLPGGQSTRDLFGRRFVLLTGPTGQQWQSAAGSAATALGIGIDCHRMSDMDCQFGAAYGVGADGAVLVRPDGVIAWRSPDTTGREGLTAALRTVLARPA